MVIERKRYVEALEKRMHNGMIKVITGMRRSGKSFLLFELFYHHLLESGVDLDHIIKISLDDYGNKYLRNPDVLYSLVKSQIKDQKMYYVLLDEIQMVEHFEDVLNGFLHIKNCDTYVTGSNAKFLSKDIITEFRGRGDQIHMFPLSFNEYYSLKGGNQNDAWNEYMYYGGLPFVALLNDYEQKRNYLESILTETYLADIFNRHQIHHETEFIDLMNILASSIGSLTNPTKLSNTFKSEKKLDLSVNTIKNYLDYLDDSFITESAMRYDVKGRKYISTPKKYYFMDIGLRNAKLNFRQMEETHIMENIIYNELRYRGFSVDVGCVEVTDKNMRVQLEVDFVANKGPKRFYIQSAFRMETQEKLAQESRSLSKINDGFEKVIIVKDGYLSGKDQNGYTILTLFDFLLKDEHIK